MFALLSAKDLLEARELAGQFPRRTTPHALAKHGSLAAKDVEPETRAEQIEEVSTVDGNSPGLLYGTWWHEFMETMAWELPAEAWEQMFVEAQARSPQPERSSREWELFRRSELARWLGQPGRLIHAEMPFLCPLEDGSCLEGVMDLAGFAEGEGCWHVIDWKTNRVGADGSGALVEIYRGQIEAYARALQQILGGEVRGSLYVTATGEWLPIA
jgi:ATP-dependent exoDNAse (exonuclease V) beta subunit